MPMAVITGSMAFRKPSLNSTSRPRQTHGLRSADVVRREDLDHRAADHLQDGGDQDNDECQDRQHEGSGRLPGHIEASLEQRVHRVHASDGRRRVDPGGQAAHRTGEPSQPVKEEVDQEKSQPEQRHRRAGSGDEPHDAVGPAALTRGRENPDRDPDQARQHHGIQADLERRGHPAHQLVGDRTARHGRGPEIPCTTPAR